MEQLKELKLKEGFHVNSWTGKVTPVSYCEIVKTEYDFDKDVFLVFNEGKFISELTKYSQDKIFDNFKDAEEYGKERREKLIQYYTDQIKSCQETLEKI